MKPRQKSFSAEKSRLEISQNGAPYFRQMTITESFKNRKTKPFKMEKPVVVTNVSHVIDSDSDAETPPQFEFERAGTIWENDLLLPDRTMMVVGAASPPKKPITMIGVYKPNTPTPNSASKNNITPVMPHISLPPSPNGLSLKDSPHSVGSNSSNKTIRYQYQDSPSLSIWDESTVPFPSNDLILPNQIDTDENLIMNYDEENAMEAFSKPINNNYDIQPNITEPNSVVKRLNFNNTSDNNSTCKAEKKKNVEKKKRIPKRNKTIDADNQNQKSKNTKNTTDIILPKKPRKRKNCAVSDGNRQKIKNIVKETSVLEQSLTNSGKKINTTREMVQNNKIITNTVKENSYPSKSLTKTSGTVFFNHINSITLTPLPRLPLKQSGSIEHRPPTGISSCVMSPFKDVLTLPAGDHDKLPVTTVELIRQDPPNDVNIDVSKKKDNLSGIIDKLYTNNRLTINRVPKESRDISQVIEASNTSQNKISDTPKKEKYSNNHPRNVLAASARKNMSPTGWISKTTIASNSGTSSEILLLDKKGQNKAQNITPNKTIEKNSTIKPNKVILDKSEVGLGTTSLENLTQTKQNNATSKSSRVETTLGVSANASAKASNVTAQASTSRSTNNCLTPEKQKMGHNTSVRNSGLKRRLFRSDSTGSPRKRVSGSPNKDSPVKNREIKSIRSKQGKRLQVRQMDELINLFKMATTNRHLKTLLNGRESEILGKFSKMEDDKKYFLMKLFVWKRLWYNIFNFCSKAQIEYDDEKDIVDIFEYLREEKLVDTDYKTSCNLFELLNRLDLRKVKEIMEERNIKPIRSKEENIKTILTAANRQTTLTSKSFKELILESIEKKMGFAIKIKEDVVNTFYHAYLLATFVNPTFYKIEDYFRNIVHLPVVYPETLVEDYPVFYSREKFTSYGRALKIRADMEEQFTNKNRDCKLMGLVNIGEDAYEQLDLDTEDTQDHLKAPHLKRFTARHVYTGILSFCCEKLFTKNGHPKEVKKWLEFLIKRFPTSRRLGKWYELLIKLHMRHLENISFESAAKVLIEALGTKEHLLGDIARYDLGELGNQLKSNKRHKIDQMYHDRIIQIIPRPIDIESFPQEQIDSQCIRSEEAGKKREYITKTIDGMVVRSVEEVAIAHYAQNGYPEGEHVEGSPIRALLMLFFWDIIYNPSKVIPGTFLSKLQTAPLDMFSPYFYENRRELIDKRLAEIDSGWPEDKLIDFAGTNWQHHSHEQSAFGEIINVIKDQSRVDVLITVIGRKVLAKIFERILKHSREFRSGMPDLLVWNIDRKESKFVEVKGEGDKLSTNQKLWLQYLQQSGASIEVCHVHSTGSKKKKIKKVPVGKEPGRDKPEPSSKSDE